MTLVADSNDYPLHADPQRDAQLRKVKVHFIDWLALPREERRPPTMTAFANHWGVSANTLTKWKKTREIEREVYRRNRDIVGDDLPAILKSIVEEAKKGSLGHQKLALEIVGYLDPDVIKRYRLEEDVEQIREAAGKEAISMDEEDIMDELDQYRKLYRERKTVDEED